MVRILRSAVRECNAGTAILALYDVLVKTCLSYFFSTRRLSARTLNVKFVLTVEA